MRKSISILLGLFLVGAFLFQEQAQLFAQISKKLQGQVSQDLPSGPCLGSASNLNIVQDEFVTLVGAPETTGDFLAANYFELDRDQNRYYLLVQMEFATVQTSRLMIYTGQLNPLLIPDARSAGLNRVESFGHVLLSPQTGTCGSFPCRVGLWSDVPVVFQQASNIEYDDGSTIPGPIGPVDGIMFGVNHGVGAQEPGGWIPFISDGTTVWSASHDGVGNQDIGQWAGTGSVPGSEVITATGQTGISTTPLVGEVDSTRSKLWFTRPATFGHIQRFNQSTKAFEATATTTLSGGFVTSMELADELALMFAGVDLIGIAKVDVTTASQVGAQLTITPGENFHGRNALAYDTQFDKVYMVTRLITPQRFRVRRIDPTVTPMVIEQTVTVDATSLVTNFVISAVVFGGGAQIDSDLQRLYIAGVDANAQEGYVVGFNLCG